jgi:hypothetical protein
MAAGNLIISPKTKVGELLEVTTPFVPTPVIDMLKDKGFRVFSIQKENRVVSYFVK